MQKRMDCLVKAALLVGKVVQIAWQMACFSAQGYCAWRLKASENSVKKGVRGGRRDERSGGKQNITKGFRDVLINVYLCIDKTVFHSTI